MMNAVHLITLSYAALIRLYPKRFRDEFAQEMQAVFALAVTEAAEGGVQALLALCLRELWDLPIALLRARLFGAVLGNWVARRLPLPVRRGALGFGLGFAAIEIISGVTREMQGIPYNFGIDFPLAILLFPLVGGLNGVFLCSVVDLKNRCGTFALAGALGCGLGGFLMFTPVPFVPFRTALMGGFIARMMVGALQNRKDLLGATLTIALGFGLGSLVGQIFMTMVRFSESAGPTLGEYAQSEAWGAIATGALANGIAGMIGGAILGATLGRHKEKSMAQTTLVQEYPSAEESGMKNEIHSGQYTRKRVLCLWAAAALPMALLAWVVTPALIPRINLPAAVLYWLTIAVGMVWQLVMALWILHRKEGRLNWTVLRHCLWLAAPRNPRTGGAPKWLILRLAPCWFVGLTSLGLGTLLTCLGLTLFFRFGFPPLLGILLWPSHANLTELASPEFAGQWGLVIGALIVWTFGAFFAEELFFRGLLLPKMDGAFGRWDWVVNAALHGFYYLHRPWMIPFRFISSLAVAWPARRFRSNRLALVVRTAEFPILLAVVLIGVTSSVLEPLPNQISFPNIDTRPALADWQRGTMIAIPSYDPNSDEMWQMDLRGYDLSALDLRDAIDDLFYAAFDSRTVWPPDDRMPTDFDWEEVLELGKEPGLGIRDLHARGITGRGVGVAIIDQSLLTEHQEYADQLRWYEQIAVGDSTASMHGPAVASIAVGKTIGVAPEAELYYIGVGAGLKSGFLYYHLYAQGIRRILQINERLPEDQKIRVISISLGWSRQGAGYHDMVAAVKEATQQGMLIVCSSIDEVHGTKFHGLGRFPLSDPDAFDSYEPGTWWARWFYDGDQFSDRLLVPMDSRTTASPTDADEYVFYREGGWSWAIPYIAGLYALAVQVEPTITPERFWALALDTGRTIKLEHEGQVILLGPIVDPVALVDALLCRCPVQINRQISAKTVSGD